MIYIWVRRPVDWEDEEAALAQLEDTSMVPLWNATFNLSYQRFRHRLAEIARLNHAWVEGAVRADWDEIPEGAVVLPVDDDDWFAPDAATALEPRAAAYLWQSRWIEVPVDLGHRVSRHISVAGAEVALQHQQLRDGQDRASKELLFNHIRASRWFEGNGESVKRLDRPLSAANRTLASRTTLVFEGKALTRRDLLRKYRRYKQSVRAPAPE